MTLGELVIGLREILPPDLSGVKNVFDIYEIIEGRKLGHSRRELDEGESKAVVDQGSRLGETRHGDDPFRLIQHLYDLAPSLVMKARGKVVVANQRKLGGNDQGSKQAGTGAKRERQENQIERDKEEQAEIAIDWNDKRDRGRYQNSAKK